MLGTAVRSLRLHRGMTQAQLATAARVSRQWVVNVEAGRTKGIEVGRLMRVLDVLHGSLHIHVDSPDDISATLVEPVTAGLESADEPERFVVDPATGFPTFDFGRVVTSGQVAEMIDE